MSVRIIIVWSWCSMFVGSRLGVFLIGLMSVSRRLLFVDLGLIIDMSC